MTDTLDSTDGLAHPESSMQSYHRTCNARNPASLGSGATLAYERFV